MDTSRNRLYIPKKIKAGFQKRSDTFNGKLSYIIYYDDKNVLRKEKSWTTWRDKKIEAEDYDNAPISGFVLHKDVKRYNWDHFSSKRTLIRVFDPRGMEFEITTDNLLFILQNTDCIKRELTGEFVYAWYGPELILLPKNTEEYEQSSQFTQLQAKKVSAKNLVPGRTYKTKKDGDVMYVGRYDWHDYNHGYGSSRKDNPTRKPILRYIFADHSDKTFIVKDSLDFLAAEISEDISPKLAATIDKFNKNPHSSAIVSFELVKDEIAIPKVGEYSYTASGIAFKLNEKDKNIVEILSIGGNHDYSLKRGDIHKLYTVHVDETFIDLSNNSLGKREKNYGGYGGKYCYYSAPKLLELKPEDFNSSGLYNLYANFQNGMRIKVKSLDTL